MASAMVSLTSTSLSVERERDREGGRERDHKTRLLIPPAFPSRKRDMRHDDQGYKKLMEQNLPGRQLQDIIKLPYITEEGVLGESKEERAREKGGRGGVLGDSDSKEVARLVGRKYD